MKFLVTGAAGFIGFHLCKRLLEMGHTVVGLDNLNDYYSVSLKKDRLKVLQRNDQFTFFKIDLADREDMESLFANNQFTHVVNMAAQAGVRYSLENPMAYVQSNIVGFTNLLEGCRHGGVSHLVYASSSSVYGLNTPFQRGPSHQPVRGIQKVQRAHGARLQPPLRAALHRTSLLHGVRTLGQTGHGTFPVHKSYRGR
ncbi:MAG: UDP-glucuronate [Desulfovibrionaceae bacterium]|nr:MAG: UDP-glucuronate [Desulfovibrionaceae bacterium]